MHVLLTNDELNSCFDGQNRFLKPALHLTAVMKVSNYNYAAVISIFISFRHAFNIFHSCRSLLFLAQKE